MKVVLEHFPLLYRREKLLRKILNYSQGRNWTPSEASTRRKSQEERNSKSYTTAVEEDEDEDMDTPVLPGPAQVFWPAQ